MFSASTIKIWLKHHSIYLFILLPGNDMDLCDSPLLGHSLTWSDEKTPATPNKHNRLFAKLWMPAFANDADLINLASYSTEFSKLLWLCTLMPWHRNVVVIRRLNQSVFKFLWLWTNLGEYLTQFAQIWPHESGEVLIGALTSVNEPEK